MKNLLRLTLATLLLSTSLAHAESTLRIKNARQLFQDMVAVLGVPGTDFQYVQAAYQQLLANLPDKGQLSELTPALDSILRLSSAVCERAVPRMLKSTGYDVQSAPSPNGNVVVYKWLPGHPETLSNEALVQTMYQQVLGREATQGEMQKLMQALTVIPFPVDLPGRVSTTRSNSVLLLACMQSTTSLDFLLLPKGEAP